MGQSKLQVRRGNQPTFFGTPWPSIDFISRFAQAEIFMQILCPGAVDNPILKLPVIVIVRLSQLAIPLIYEASEQKTTTVHQNPPAGPSLYQNMLLLPIIIHTLLVGSLASTKCDEYIANLINNRFLTLKNVTILYSGLAINNPGQMEECQKENFNYFLIYLPNKPPQLTAFTGLCIPNDCDQQDVQEQVSYFTNAQTFDYSESTWDGLAWVGLILLFVYAAITVAVMTVNSFKDEQLPNRKELSTEEQTKVQINMSVNDKDSLIQPIANPSVSKSDRNLLLRLFGAYDHYCKIFHVSPKKNVLSGLKFMSVFMVVVATEFSFRQNISQNDDKAATILNSGLGYIITNVDFAYSTLLFIAGLSAAYALYKIDSFTEMFKSIVSKFVRLWPVLVLFVLFAYTASEAIVADPLSKVWEQKNTLDCPAIFWRKWFLINPLILDGTICLPWTWLIETELLLFLFAPLFIVVSRSSKFIGYSLLLVVIAISIAFSAFFLDYKKIEFVPSLIFNNTREFTYEWQMNPLVRASNFAMGMLFGIFFINALEKIESQDARTNEYKISKVVKRSKPAQAIIQIVGVILMTVAFWLIVPVSSDDVSAGLVKFFLAGCPAIFLFGLGLFIFPSVIGADAWLTRFINKLLAGSFWAPLQKMSLSIYLVAPVVIGITTYSLQTSLYYSYEQVLLLLLGDLVLVLLAGLVFTACVEMPCIEAQKELDYYIFGPSNKESIVVIQD